jgi:uncharacterized protein YjbI with pentapeptide repeats
VPTLVNVVGTNLSGAGLSGANLKIGATSNGPTLKERGADLERTNLCKNLIGANLMVQPANAMPTKP